MIPLTYESTVAAHIRVIGDALGTGLPKAAHIANSDAKIGANPVVTVANG